MIDTNKSLLKYEEILESASALPGRLEQANTLSQVINEYFKFDVIECVETGANRNFSDGCFGLFLCDLINQIGGVYHSVDIDSEVIENSKNLCHQYYPEIQSNHYVMDSVKFLKNYDGCPNLVHLDSMDLNLTNPVSSMLHSWLEFDAIRDKMPSGSICLIDDNFLKGTWVSWNTVVDNKIVDSKIIDIEYDIVGKGSLIYHWCKNYETEWEIVGNHYLVGSNVKLILRKK